ncbi:MAG: DUF2313 domain-containing protein [Clostridia bacterium]|nr:DUF2313 domain-containing protein [Clostridia bacterium]
MRYADELVRLLLPLGVYSFAEGSFSLGELQALGAALDEQEQMQRYLQRESIVETAEEEGLAKMAALFRHFPEGLSVQAKRAAIAGFLRVGGDSFTLQALQSCLLACGAECVLEETGINRVKVSFPQVMGVPEGFAQMRIIIEDILPCQLEIDYFFRYCTWAETAQYGLTWGDLGQMSWDAWRHYRP